jgi:hypothetical protein
VSHRPPSLWEFLEHRLVEGKNEAHHALLRERLARSELLTMMDRIADAVNSKAGGFLIDAQSYLPPEALVRSFSFRKAETEYILQLESWGSDPTLVFLTRYCRGPVFVTWFGWICRLFGADEYVIDVKFRSQFRMEDVTEVDVERWFTYLISGFDRAFAPLLADASVAESHRPTRQTEIVDEG